MWQKQQPYSLNGEPVSSDTHPKGTEGFVFAEDPSESNLPMLSAPHHFDCGIAPTEPCCAPLKM
jgi:hypothetical protein